jgi:hypothetical protein
MEASSVTRPFLGISPQFEKAVCNLFTSFFRTAADSSEDEELMQRARLFIWQLDRAYSEATDGRSARDLLQELSNLMPPAETVRKAVIAWVDLVEVLVQESERQYGTEGRGAYKAEQVKAVLIHLLLDDPTWRVPQVPQWLLPIGVELIASWSIDAIVALLNHNDAWEPAPPRGLGGGIKASLLARIIMAIVRWLRDHPILQDFDLFLASIARKMVLASHPLTAAARKALGDLERTGLASVNAVVTRTAKVGTWVGQHHKEIVAFVQLISVAVHEAESFSQMSGPEKKIYARDLLIVFLEDTGFVRDDTPLSNFVTKWLIDWGIDSVVDIFNKRRVFQHNQLTTTPVS